MVTSNLNPSVMYTSKSKKQRVLSPLVPVRNSEPLPREGSSPPTKSQGETWPPLELFSAYITRGVGAPLMFYTTLCSPWNFLSKDVWTRLVNRNLIKNWVKWIMFTRQFLDILQSVLNVRVQSYICFLNVLYTIL